MCEDAKLCRRRREEDVVMCRVVGGHRASLACPFRKKCNKNLIRPLISLRAPDSNIQMDGKYHAVGHYGATNQMATGLEFSGGWWARAKVH